MWRASGADALPDSDAPAPETAAPLPPTPALLTQGGDDRIVLRGAGQVNRYGCAPAPDGDVLAFGSSTASTISQAGFAAAETLRTRLAEAAMLLPPSAVYKLELDRLRRELLQLCGLEGRGVEVLVSASGTDLHRLAAQLVAGDAARPPLAILCEESETGGGVPSALSGTGPGTIQPISVPARAFDGQPRDSDQVDAEVEALAAQAAQDGRRVLLVLTDVTKTGLVSPSPACAARLSRRYPELVTVLVDGCQFRLSASSLKAYVDLGWMIAVTGSKFLSGPAFSGTLLVPEPLARTFRECIPPSTMGTSARRADWPTGWSAARQFPAEPNFGLLLRWEAALEEFRRFRAVPEEEVERFLGRFSQAVGLALTENPLLEPVPGRLLDRGLGDGGWDREPTTFPFLLNGLTLEQTQGVHAMLGRALDSDRVELGQPVPCGVRDGAALTALRMCASARLVVEACLHTPGAEDRVLDRACLALDKTAWLAAEVRAGRL